MVCFARGSDLPDRAIIAIAPADATDAFA